MATPSAQLQADLKRLVEARKKAVQTTHPADPAAQQAATAAPLPDVYDDTSPPASLPAALYQAVEPQTFAVGDDQAAAERTARDVVAPVAGKGVADRLVPAATELGEGLGRAVKGLASTSYVGLAGRYGRTIKEGYDKDGLVGAAEAVPRAALTAPVETIADIPQAVGEVFGGLSESADAGSTLRYGRSAQNLRSEGPTGWALRLAGTAMSAPVTEFVGEAAEAAGLASAKNRERTWRQQGSNPVSAFGYDTAEAIKRGDGFMSLANAISKTQGYEEGSAAQRALQLGGFAADAVLPTDILVGGLAKGAIHGPFHVAELAKHGVPKSIAAATVLGHMIPDYIPRIKVADLGEQMRARANERFSQSIEQEIKTKRENDPALSRDDAVATVFRDAGRALLGDHQLVHVTGVGTFAARDVPRLKEEMGKLFEPYGGRAPEVGTPIDVPQMQKTLAALKLPLELAETPDGLVTPQLREHLINTALQNTTIKPSQWLKRYSPLHEATVRAVETMLPESVQKLVKPLLDSLPSAAIREMEFAGPFDMLKRDLAKMPEEVARAFWESRKNHPDMTAAESLMSFLEGGVRKMENAERVMSGTPDWTANVRAKLETERAALAKRTAERRTKIRGDIEKVKNSEAHATARKAVADAVKKVFRLKEEFRLESEDARPPSKTSGLVSEETKEVHREVGKYLWDNRGNPAKTKRSQVVKEFAKQGKDPIQVKQALGAFQASRDYNPRTGEVSTGKPEEGVQFEARSRRLNKHTAHAAVVMDQLRGTEVDPSVLSPLTKEDRLNQIMHRANREFDKIRENKATVEDYERQIADLEDQAKELPTDPQHAEALRNITDDVSKLHAETVEPKTRAQMQGLLSRLAGYAVGDIPFSDIGRAFDEVREVQERAERDTIDYAKDIEEAFVGALSPRDMTLERAKRIVQAFAEGRLDSGAKLRDLFEGEGEKLDPEFFGAGAVRMIVNERMERRLQDGVENMARSHAIDPAEHPELVDAINDILGGRVAYRRERGKLTIPGADPAHIEAASYIDRWGLANLYDNLTNMKEGGGLQIPDALNKEIAEAINRGEVPQFGWRNKSSTGANVSFLLGKYRSWYKQEILLATATPLGLPRYLLPQVLGAQFSMMNELGLRGSLRVWSRWATHPELLAAVASGDLAIPKRYAGRRAGQQLGAVDVFDRFHSAGSLEREVRERSIDTGQIRVEAAEGIVRLIQSELEGRLPWMRDAIAAMREVHAKKKKPGATIAGLISHVPGAYKSWVKFLWDSAGAVDHAMRVSVFVDQRLQGKSADQAATAARNALLDFGKMTKWERDVLSKVFLFYSFTRANVDSYLHGLSVDPSRIGRQARFLRELPAAVSGDQDTENMRDIDKGRLYFGESAKTGPKGEKFAYQTAPMPLVSFLGMLTDVLGAGQSGINAMQADPDTAGPKLRLVPQDAAGTIGDVIGAAGPEAQAAYELKTGETPAGYHVGESSADNEVPGWLIWLGHLTGGDMFDQLQADAVSTRSANPKRAWLGDEVTYTANNEYLWKNIQRFLGLSSALRDVDRTTHGLLPGITGTPLPTREEAQTEAARGASKEAKEVTKTLGKRTKGEKAVVRKGKGGVTVDSEAR